MHLSLRIGDLKQIPAIIKFVSFEPLLSYIHITIYSQYIDWAIVSGESGQDARPMSAKWIRRIRDKCLNLDIPFFFKGWGEWVSPTASHLHYPIQELDRFPQRSVDGHVMFRVGRHRAGRDLDGREWNQLP